MRTKKEKIKLEIKNRKPITQEIIYNSTVDDICKLCYQYNDVDKRDNKQTLYKDDYISIIFYNFYWDTRLRIIMMGDNYYRESVEVIYYYNTGIIDKIANVFIVDYDDTLKKANLDIIKMSSLVKHFIRGRNFIKNYATDKHFMFKYAYERDKRYKTLSLNEKVSSSKRLHMYTLYLYDKIDLELKINELKMKIKEKELVIKSYKQRFKFHSAHPYSRYPIFNEKDYQKETAKANKSIDKLKKDISSAQEDMSKVQDEINKLKVNNYYASEIH